MFGKSLVSSLIILSMVLLPITISAQSLSCVKHPDDPERYMVCDGETYRYFSEQEDKQLAKKLVELKKKKEKINQLEKKISFLEFSNSEKDAIINHYQRQYKIDQGMISKILDRPFYKEPGFNFIMGAVVSGMFYGFWSWTDNK